MKPINYILDGRTPVPCEDLKQWVAWFGQANATGGRIVARTDTYNGVVSTVFLGIDHSWGSDSPPVLFETMVFGGTCDEEQHRYCTWEQAEAGHRDVVARVTGQAPDSGANTSPENGTKMDR